MCLQKTFYNTLRLPTVLSEPYRDVNAVEAGQAKQANFASTNTCHHEKDFYGHSMQERRIVSVQKFRPRLTGLNLMSQILETVKSC